MNKKLIAVAVAGALGAPALAFAQASTVNIYGSMRLEYGSVDEGGTRNRYTRLHNPGSSYLGFKGEEKLGGDMSAWFQVEQNISTDGSAAGAPTGSQFGGLADRNTAVGLKGGWGNFFLGQWDTAYKRSSSGKYRPFDSTGLTGVGAILHNETSGNTDNAANTSSFHRRQANSLNYDSPVWSGFQVMGNLSTTEEKSGSVSTVPFPNAWLWGLGGTYENGPLYIGAGYERHNNYRAIAGAPAGTFGTDTGWNINAAYTFAGVFRLGAIYEHLKYETGAAANAAANNTRNAWGIFGDWAIQGPHTLRLGYTRANDSSGGGTAVNSIGGSVPGATIVNQQGIVVPQSDNGAKLWSIMYAYALSKRTEVNLFYSRLDNDSAGLYRLHATTRSTGQDATAYGFGLRHTF